MMCLSDPPIRQSISLISFRSWLRLQISVRVVFTLGREWENLLRCRWNVRKIRTGIAEVAVSKTTTFQMVCVRAFSVNGNPDGTKSNFFETFSQFGNCNFNSYMNFSKMFLQFCNAFCGIFYSLLHNREIYFAEHYATGFQLTFLYSLFSGNLLKCCLHYYSQAFTSVIRPPANTSIRFSLR